MKTIRNMLKSELKKKSNLIKSKVKQNWLSTRKNTKMLQDTLNCNFFFNKKIEYCSNVDAYSLCKSVQFTGKLNFSWITRHFDQLHCYKEVIAILAATIFYHRWKPTINTVWWSYQAFAQQKIKNITSYKIQCKKPHIKRKTPLIDSIPVGVRDSERGYLNDHQSLRFFPGKPPPKSFQLAASSASYQKPGSVAS